MREKKSSEVLKYEQMMKNRKIDHNMNYGKLCDSVLRGKLMFQ